MAGYSGTPLVQKIGIKPGSRIILRNHPPTFLSDLGTLPGGAECTERLTGKADVVVCFTDRKSELVRNFASLASRLNPAGMLWISWPKKASGVATDLNENIVREIGLECGLVDVKVCAIDETWSGLKFVVRLKDRPATGKKMPAKKRGN